MIVRRGLESYKIQILEASLSQNTNNTNIKKKFAVSHWYISPRLGGPYIFNRYRDQKFQLIRIKTILIPTLEQIQKEKEEKLKQETLDLKSKIDYTMDQIYVAKNPRLIAMREKLESMYHEFYDRHPEFYREYDLSSKSL